MKPVRIIIENIPERSLAISEIKYTFRTLLSIAGLPFHFIEDEKERADIYYGKDCPGDYGLFIEMADIRRENIGRPIKAVKENNHVFLLFTNRQREDNLLITNTNNTCIWNDIILSSFYLLSGWEERFIHRDRKDRHVVQESFLYREKILHDPIVNQYSTMLRNLFRTSHNPIPLWPSNKRYAVALSHDVDYPEMFRWIEVLRYLGKYRMKSKMRKVIDIIIGKESFWKFEDWVKLENRYGLKSAMYFCGAKGSLLRYVFKAPDPFYDVRQDQFKRVLNYLAQNGFEVGLHSSYLAYQSTDRFLEEKKTVEESLREPIFGNRHHYWHMNPDNLSETALIHDEIGLLYDSSVCFAKRCGFRFGICSPFHLYDPIRHRHARVLELPTSLMDDHLFKYFGLSYFSKPQFEIDALINSVKEHGGVFLVDYHVRGFNETFYPKWVETYKYILNKINEDGDFYSDTPLNIARYWKNREEDILRESKDEYCGVTKDQIPPSLPLQKGGIPLFGKEG
jgi:hypothetical protein